MNKYRLTALVCFISLVSLSCAGVTTGAPRAAEELSVRDTAQRLISSDISNRLGFGRLEPVCEEVPQPVHGYEFRCSAATGDARNVHFNGKIEADGRVSVVSTNALAASDVVKLENAAIAYTNQQLGSNYGTQQITCGDSAILLNPERVVGCIFTEPSSGQQFDAEVRIDDLVNLTVVARISDQPRQ